MAELRKGARLAFEWLQTLKAGERVSRQEVLDATGWQESSLKTYVTKNKITPFLQPTGTGEFKVVLDGDEITEGYFHEVFTQSAPPKLSLGANDVFKSATSSYQLIEPLGNGAVGHVWSAKQQGASDVVAVKVMQPREDLLRGSKLPNVRKRFRREAEYGRQLSHPNIIQIRDSGDQQGNPFLVMEMARRSVGKQLRDEGKLAEDDAAAAVYACALGLEHLHGHGAPHRDVKPDNILECEDGLKLGDLGIVKWTDFDPALTMGGTITHEAVQLGSWFYMSPEQQQSPHGAGPPADLYALGVSWVEMLSGQRPAPQAIGAGAYHLPEVVDGVVDLIRRMVRYEPNQRPDVSEVRSFLETTYRSLA